MFQEGAFQILLPVAAAPRGTNLWIPGPFRTSPTTYLFPQGKKLPANISADAEEGEVSDEDSADEIEDDCKLLSGDVSGRQRL